MYALGWVLSFVIGGVAYYVACLIFRVPGADAEKGLRFEQLVSEADQLAYDGVAGEFVDGRGPTVVEAGRSSYDGSRETDEKRAEKIV
jgi:NCS1 family nucleobase:cation symporter-1